MKKGFLYLIVGLVLGAISLPIAIASADDGRTLDHVQISPTSATVPINGSQQLKAVALDSANLTVAHVDYTWAIIAGGGNVTNSGLFTATNVASISIVQVIATKDNVTRAANVNVNVVIPGPLDHVVIFPTSVNLRPKGTKQFKAVAQDSANLTLTNVTFNWAVIAGSGNITASGLFTAASSSGNSTVQVTATQGAIARTATAIATVSASSKEQEGRKGPKARPHGWDQGKKKGWDGGNTPPGLSKGDKQGNDEEGNQQRSNSEKQKHGNESSEDD